MTATEILDEIQQEVFRGGPVHSRDGKRLYFGSVIVPEVHFDALVAALRAVLALMENPDHCNDAEAYLTFVHVDDLAAAITKALVTT